MNTLCQDDDYTVTVTFGNQTIGLMDCELEQSSIITMTIMKSPALNFSVPADIIAGEEEEYCYCVELSNDQGVIDGMHY